MNRERPTRFRKNRFIVRVKRQTLQNLVPARSGPLAAGHGHDALRTLRIRQCGRIEVKFIAEVSMPVRRQRRIASLRRLRGIMAWHQCRRKILRLHARSRRGIRRQGLCRRLVPDPCNRRALHILSRTIAPGVRKKTSYRRFGFRTKRHENRAFCGTRKRDIQKTHALGAMLGDCLCLRLVIQGDMQVHLLVVVEIWRLHTHAIRHRHDDNRKLKTLRHMDRHDLERVALALQLPRIFLGILLAIFVCGLVDPLG